MKLSQPVRFGAWLLIALNLLMSFGSIWIFMRMAPAIEVIIVKNEVSLHACEEMLAALSMKGVNEPGVTPHIDSFKLSLSTAQNNITEREEPLALNAISKSYINAFKGDDTELKRTVEAILQLGEINRSAMVKADGEARHLGYAGAWGVVFMASVVFLIGMFFLRGLKKNLSDPLEEIDSVVRAFRNGDTMRRCTGKSPSRNIKQVFNNLDELLDGKFIHDLTEKQVNSENFHKGNKKL